MTDRERQIIIAKVREHGNMTIMGAGRGMVSNRDIRLFRQSGIKTINEGLGIKFVKTGAKNERSKD